MFLADVSIKRPVFATMMMVMLVVLGVVSYRRLAIDEYPDVTYPVIVAQTAYPGASPEAIAREVSRPIEEALNTVQGLQEVSSTSFEGSSLVRLIFKLDVNVMEAQQDVQAKVARIRRQLPQNILDPVIIRFDPNDRPIMSIAIQSTERPIRELTDLADEVISTRIESEPGVGGVNVIGGTERQIRVELDAAAMRSYAISPPEVIAALQRENQDVPAGRVTHGETERLIRVTGRIVEPRAFADITVGVRNGVAIRIGDIGSIQDASADRRSAATLNGKPAVSIDILKISGSNTVEVANGVRRAVAELQRQIPSDVQLAVIRDDSKSIKDSLADVQLTIMIIFLFLNSWRSTVITGLTLPVSIISAFFIMWIFGFTVNTMTLLALSLAIGLLIDDAIVVRENIVRHLEMGKDHIKASSEGTDEIGLAVLSTTLAVVAVFVPVAFMGGMIGKIFFQFGVTVAFAVLVSLLVSFTLDPMLSSVWADPDIEHSESAHQKAGPIRRFSFWFNDGFESIAGRYPGWLARALTHRLAVVGIAVVAIGLALAIVPRLGFTFMPEYDAGEFTLGFRAPPGSRIEYTEGKANDLSEMVRKHKEVAFTYTTVGGGFRGSPSNGQVFVKMLPKKERTKSMAELQNEIRPALFKIPGIRASIQGTRSIFGGYRPPIVVNVQGPEPTRLKIAADRVLQVLKRVPGVAEPQSSDEGEIPQLDIQVDRQQAWAAGVGIGSIAATLQPLFAGQIATEWEDPQGYSHDVVVVYPDSMRTDAADVAGIVIPSNNRDSRTGLPAMVPLSQVAQIRAGNGPQQIERRALERQVSISAGVLPGRPVGDVANAVRAAIDSIGLPPGYHTVFTGDVQNLEETKGYVLEAIILAVLFIYLILASLFGSFLQPLSIMLALPLAFIGVALALLVTRGNLNVMTMIGIIMLMGLVTKNGILLIDFTNQERARGMERTDALLSAARIRLRPIIMTTVAMIFGMIPLALALGEGAEQRAPMARAVIGGLVTSTALTLFVVPVVYSLLDDFVLGLKRRRARAAHGSHVPPETLPEPATAGD